MPSAGSLKPSEVDMVRAMDILHDPNQRTVDKIFSIDLPFARLVVNGAAHGAAGDIASGIFSKVRGDFTNDEWNQVYGSAFSCYRAGFEAGYLLVKAEIGAELANA